MMDVSHDPTGHGSEKLSTAQLRRSHQARPRDRVPVLQERVESTSNQLGQSDPVDFDHVIDQAPLLLCEVDLRPDGGHTAQYSAHLASVTRLSNSIRREPLPCLRDENEPLGSSGDHLLSDHGGQPASGQTSAAAACQRRPELDPRPIHVPVRRFLHFSLTGSIDRSQPQPADGFEAPPIPRSQRHSVFYRRCSDERIR